MPALHNAISLTRFFTPPFFDAMPPWLSEWGPWAVGSMVRPTPGLQAGTVSGLRDFTQTKDLGPCREPRRNPLAIGEGFLCTHPDVASLTRMPPHPRPFRNLHGRPAWFPATPRCSETS